MAKRDKKENNDYLINDELNINDKDNVRIIYDDQKTEVVTFAEAKRIATKQEKDLIGWNCMATIPILKIAQYDKFIYDLKKNQKKNKQVVKPLKEIDLRVNIASNDLDTKVRKAKEFIADGSKVKVVLTMKGREMSRQDYSRQCITEFTEKMSDVAVPESALKIEGNKTTVIFKKK